MKFLTTYTLPVLPSPLIFQLFILTDNRNLSCTILYFLRRSWIFLLLLFFQFFQHLSPWMQITCFFFFLAASEPSALFSYEKKASFIHRFFMLMQPFSYLCSFMYLLMEMVQPQSTIKISTCCRRGIIVSILISAITTSRPSQDEALIFSPPKLWWLSQKPQMIRNAA